MDKIRFFGIIPAVLVLVFLGGVVGVWAKSGTLELKGVPQDVSAGSYDTQSGVFYVDVTDLEEAFVIIRFEDMEIVGKELEWHTKDDYFVFRNTARLEKEDFKVTGRILEYFGEKGELVVQGDVEVITEEATVHSQKLVYDEEKDEALFTEQVVVLFSEGTVQGEKFLMFVEKRKLTFFGIFQGEFETDSN